MENKPTTFLINKAENSSSITLQIMKPNKIFLKSIMETNILIAPSLNSSFTKLQFIGSSVTTLAGFIEKIFLETGSRKLPYNTVVQIIWCISQQQAMLEKNGFGFYSLAVEDIMVVNDWDFFCTNPSLTHPINSDFKFMFNHPFERNDFSSPEIQSLTKLPACISVKTFYYSLGSIAFFCLFRNYFDQKELIFDISLPIFGTKLHWCLERALKLDIEKRCLIFI
jgi:hypothetical protein